MFLYLLKHLAEGVLLYPVPVTELERKLLTIDEIKDNIRIMDEVRERIRKAGIK
jgi:hypothetical protein